VGICNIPFSITPFLPPHQTEYQEEIFLVVYGKRGRKERGKRGEKLKIYDVGIHIL
jgi:hypothetical protein